MKTSSLLTSEHEKIICNLVDNLNVDLVRFLKENEDQHLMMKNYLNLLGLDIGNKIRGLVNLSSNSDYISSNKNTSIQKIKNNSEDMDDFSSYCVSSELFKFYIHTYSNSNSDNTEYSNWISLSKDQNNNLSNNNFFIAFDLDDNGFIDKFQVSMEAFQIVHVIDLLDNIRDDFTEEFQQIAIENQRCHRRTHLSQSIFELIRADGYLPGMLSLNAWDEIVATVLIEKHKETQNNVKELFSLLKENDIELGRTHVQLNRNHWLTTIINDEKDQKNLLFVRPADKLDVFQSAIISLKENKADTESRFFVCHEPEEAMNSLIAFENGNEILAIESSCILDNNPYLSHYDRMFAQYDCFYTLNDINTSIKETLEMHKKYKNSLNISSDFEKLLNEMETSEEWYRTHRNNSNNTFVV